MMKKAVLLSVFALMSAVSVASGQQEDGTATHSSLSVLPQVGVRSAPLADPYGVCAHLMRHDHAFRDEECRGIAAVGASTVRFGFAWSRLQKAPDAPFDFTYMDEVVADAEAHGLTVLPILYGIPKWAKPAYGHLDEFAAYVEAVVGHYGARFPAVEIWNEENLKGFWGEDPDPAKYVLVLKAGYEAAKRSGSPTVYLGGTAGVPMGFIEEIYKAGGGPYFDAMNIHPYSHPYAPEGDLDRKLEDLRALMAKYGDAEKPIVITEHGWPTHDATVKGASILLAGLKVARPEQKAWRAVYAATASVQQQAVAAAIEAILPPGSSCEACFGAHLRERLAAGDVDAVVYPFDSSFPADTFDDVCEFVKEGGVLVDLGGAPMWRPCREVAPGRFERQGEDNGANPLRERLRVAVDAWWLNATLPQEGRAFPTDAALAAGYKGDPAGERVWRFFTPRLLKDGDEMVPLLTLPLEAGEPPALRQEAVAACVLRFGSDFKGAIVLSGDKTRGEAVATDEAGQARYLTRAMAIAFAKGVERYFWYEFRSVEADPHYSEDHFGLTHADMTPKPAFDAYRAFVARRPAGSVQRRIPLRDAATGVWRSEWTRPDGSIAGVFWKPGETEDPVFYEGEMPVH